MKPNRNPLPVRMWNRHNSWNEAETVWDQRARKLRNSFPLKGIRHWRTLPGIRPSTRKNLRWKALRYLLENDENKVMSYFWCKPLLHIGKMIRSYWSSRSYTRDNDFFLYGFSSAEAFTRRIEHADTFLIIGFSYCHKPFECPSGRFTDDCAHDDENPVCGQCFIGKCVHAMPEKRCRPVFITTVHYIAEKIIEAIHAHPNKEVVFLITACELTLEMFGDWGNSIAIRGIGVRLDGQICNTMKAFEASERGIKPGLAVVLPKTQQRMLDAIAVRRHHKTAS